MFGLAALGLVAAGVGVASLPSRCGQLGRPNLDQATRAALIAVACLWLAGVVVLLAPEIPRRSRFALAGVGLLDVCAGIAILVYYLHQTAWHGHCG
ncbi:MAG TPA: hypothetical protein VF101_09065 [Gaiellaceae bacterium]